MNPKWEAEPSDDRGYFCVKDAQGPLIQGEVSREHKRREIHVMGDDPIVVDKMFGPLVFFPLRITADVESGDWIVERLSGADDKWHEVLRVPGQQESDFDDGEED